MKPKTRLPTTAMLLAAGLLLTAGLAQGANDDHHDRRDQDNDRRGQHDRPDQDNDRREQNDRDHGRDNRQHRNDRPYMDFRFQQQSRVVVQNYYEQQYHRGHCPAGLSRKHNNCIQSGHAKRWQVGQRLSRDVVYYDLPASLIVELGEPPRGSHYVRVASDILLIALGTGLVIDALDDLDRR